MKVCFTVLLGIILFQGASFHNRTDRTKQTELGHYLFFDRRLSSTGTKSCASCHNPQYAFTDGYRKAIGVYGDLHSRNTPSLINLSYQKYFNWANSNLTSIEIQMETPLFGSNPIEMGLHTDDKQVLNLISKDSKYRKLFANCGLSINWATIKKSISVYIMTLNSFSSPYDRYLAGDSIAISQSAKSGEQLFFSKKLKCAYCHRTPTFAADSSLPVAEQFANIGLYNYDGGNYPTDDQGLYKVTHKKRDKGKFKIPTISNLLYTAPYFHDGSAATLEEALSVFENGGRNITHGLWQGDGSKNQYKNNHIKGFILTTTEKKNLLDFLESLSDSSIFQNKLFLPPKDDE